MGDSYFIYIQIFLRKTLVRFEYKNLTFTFKILPRESNTCTTVVVPSRLYPKN